MLTRYLFLILLVGLMTSTQFIHSQTLIAGEKRYALIIGNATYQHGIANLVNPVNDATDMAALLRQLNFEVTLLTDASYNQIREGVRKFYEQLSKGPEGETVGLFYYAGHGVQYENENYLIPVDAEVQYEDDIVRTCFPVQRVVLNNMERSNSALNIVILDACRNNPFPSTSRSLGSGLAEVQRARGAFIAYATAPGSVASDGTGRNGLYTQELMKAMQIPGLLIEQVFKEVRRNVLKLSNEKQYTWDSSNILGDFFFIETNQTQKPAEKKEDPSPAPIPAKVDSKPPQPIVSSEQLALELSKLTDFSIPYKQRQTSSDSILKYFVVPHAFITIMIGSRIDERLPANKLMTRLVTLPETKINVLDQEIADSGRIIELVISLEE